MGFGGGACGFTFGCVSVGVRGVVLLLLLCVSLLLLLLLLLLPLHAPAVVLFHRGGTLEQQHLGRKLLMLPLDLPDVRTFCRFTSRRIGPPRPGVPRLRLPVPRLSRRPLSHAVHERCIVYVAFAFCGALLLPRERRYLKLPRRLPAGAGTGPPGQGCARGPHRV